MTSPRIAPLDPPYASATEDLFRIVMPEGMDPLVLFRTLARSERVLSRFMRAGVLDRGPIDIRDRELVILRTTARCDSEYEWGVHVAAFARAIGLSDEVIEATRCAAAEDPVWTPAQARLVRLCDELHERSTVSEGLWAELAAHYDEPQLLELVYLVGLYHVVSFFANALELPREPAAEGFPAARPVGRAP